MPDGITHFQIGAVCGVAASVAVAMTFPEPELRRSFYLGTLAGLFVLSPDLDQQGTTFTEKAMWAIPVVGWLAGFLFQWFWFGYALAIPHRHPLSHWPGLGTAGRLAYLAAFGGFYAWVFLRVQGVAADWWQVTQGLWHWLMAPAFLAALVWQDTLHFGADKTLKAGGK